MTLPSFRVTPSTTRLLVPLVVMLPVPRAAASVIVSWALLRLVPPL